MERMTGLDASMLYAETSTAHMHTMKVAVLDCTEETGVLDRDRLIAELDARLHLLPAMRRRPVRVPFDLHHPVWVNDPAYTTAAHISERRLPSPGGPAEFDAVLAEIHSEPLDLERPLWEMTLITGFQNGHVAVAVKVHHAVADGVAAAAGLVAVASLGPHEQVAGPADGWSPERLPTRFELLAGAVRDRLRDLRLLPALLLRTITGMTRMARARRLVERRPPAPLSGPRAPWNGRLTARRTVATAKLPLADFKTVKTAFGVTLNDVLLAVSAGGLLRAADREGVTMTKPLVSAIPATLDGPDGEPRISGNHVTQFFTSLCTTIPDPIERLRAISTVTRNARELNTALGAELMRDWNTFAHRLPYQLFWDKLMTHVSTPAINVVVSNVPGPRKPVWFAGARMVELYSLSVLTEGAGLNLTVWSYNDVMHVGLVSCPELVGDIQAMAADLEAALAELVTYAQAAGPDGDRNEQRRHIVTGRP